MSVCRAQDYILGRIAGQSSSFANAPASRTHRKRTESQSKRHTHTHQNEMAATNTQSHYYADSMYNMYHQTHHHQAQQSQHHHHALPPTYLSYDNNSSYYQSTSMASSQWQPASYQPSSYPQYAQETIGYSQESCYYASYQQEQQPLQQLMPQPAAVAPLPQYQAPVKPILSSPVAAAAAAPSRKRKAEESAAEIIAAVEERPSTLRALLTNPVKKLKYTPDYFYTTFEHVKKDATKSTSSDELTPCYEQEYAAPTPSTQQTHMSPQRSSSEDVDYLDVYSPRKQATPATPATPENIGLSTPPQSPAEKNAEINHRNLTAPVSGNEFNWSHIEETLASGRHHEQTSLTPSHSRSLYLSCIYSYFNFVNLH